MFQLNIPWRPGRTFLAGLFLGLLPLVHCGGGSGSATPDPQAGIQSLTATASPVPPGASVMARVAPNPGAVSIQWSISSPGWELTTDATQPFVAIQTPELANATGSVQVAIVYPGGRTVYGALTLATLGPGAAPLQLSVWETGVSPAGRRTFQAAAGNPSDPAAEFSWSPASGIGLAANQGGPTMTVAGPAGFQGPAIQAVTATNGSQTASVFLRGAPAGDDPARVDIVQVDGAFQAAPDGNGWWFSGMEADLQLGGFDQDEFPIPDAVLDFSLTADPQGVVDIHPVAGKPAEFKVDVKTSGAAFTLTATARDGRKSVSRSFPVEMPPERLFVADPDRKVVLIYDRVKRQITATIALTAQPGEIAVDNAGTLAVALSDGTIAVYPDYNQPVATEPVFTPSDKLIDPSLPICIDRNKNIYATAQGLESQVYKFALDNGAYVRKATYGPGLGFGGPGLTCGMGDSDSLWVFDPATRPTFLPSMTRFPSGETEPNWRLYFGAPILVSRFAYAEQVEGIYGVYPKDKMLHVWSGTHLTMNDAAPYPLALPPGVLGTNSLVIDALGTVYLFASPPDSAAAKVFPYPGKAAEDSSPIPPWDFPVGTRISGIAVTPKR